MSEFLNRGFAVLLRAIVFKFPSIVLTTFYCNYYTINHRSAQLIVFFFFFFHNRSYLNSAGQQSTVITAVMYHNCTLIKKLNSADTNVDRIVLSVENMRIIVHRMKKKTIKKNIACQFDYSVVKTINCARDPVLLCDSKLLHKSNFQQRVVTSVYGRNQEQKMVLYRFA